MNGMLWRFFSLLGTGGLPGPFPPPSLGQFLGNVVLPAGRVTDLGIIAVNVLEGGPSGSVEQLVKRLVAALLFLDPSPQSQASALAEGSTLAVVIALNAIDPVASARKRS